MNRLTTRTRAALALTLVTVLGALVGACGTTADRAGTATSGATGSVVESSHGDVPGATEMPDPQPTLVLLDAAGTVSLVDLLTGDISALGVVTPPTAVRSDGRFVYSVDDSGVEIIDSGVWAVDHGDHWHYYRAPARIVGRVTGTGPAKVSAVGERTVVSFPGSGETVLLAHSVLGTGELGDIVRLTLAGSAVSTIGDALLVAGTTEPNRLQAHRLDGAPIPDSSAPCTSPADPIETRAGIVIGCAEGAIVATNGADDRPALAVLPYPEGTAGEIRTSSPFANRAGRPTVAAVAGDAGYWLLDARAKTWVLTPTDTGLQAVTAVDDSDNTVVGIDLDGRVVVYAGDAGQLQARTQPLATPGGAGTATIPVDADRAYLIAGASVQEIDYSDAARVSRTFQAPTPSAFIVETGR